MPYRNGKLVDWKVHVKGIRELLTDDASTENAKKVGKKVYEIVTSNKYKKFFDPLEYDMYTGYLLEDFNELLNALYDWADANLIWIE